MDLTDKIKERAYEIYEVRTEYDIPGDSLSDWLQAEKDILHAKQFHDFCNITGIKGG